MKNNIQDLLEEYNKALERISQLTKANTYLRKKNAALHKENNEFQHHRKTCPIYLTTPMFKLKDQYYIKK